MARLRQRELTAFSQALLTLYSEDDSKSLSKRVLGSARQLFDCEFASFSLMDLRHGRWHTAAFSPAPVPNWPGVEVYQRHLRNDPAAAYIMRSRDPSAIKISDFVSLREYRNLSVYTEIFGRVGCNRRLGFAIQDASPVTVAATLNRSGRDFSEEDRTLLDLFRPHLLHANARAHAHRHLQAERSRERNGLGNAFGTGLGEIDAAGKLLWVTARGSTLLADFFPAARRNSAPGHLPDSLVRRLVPTLKKSTGEAQFEQAGPRRFAWQFEGPAQRKLNVRLIVGTSKGRWQMLLSEAGPSLPARALALTYRLTDREREVLNWLTQGKANGEIAIILNISVKTVGKHLEHIFTKLKVENRTAAISLVMEYSGGPLL